MPPLHPLRIPFHPPLQPRATRPQLRDLRQQPLPQPPLLIRLRMPIPRLEVRLKYRQASAVVPMRADQSQARAKQPVLE